MLWRNAIGDSAGQPKESGEAGSRSERWSVTPYGNHERDPCGPVTGGSVYLADSLPGLDRTVRPRPNLGRTGRGAETLSRIAAMAVE